MKKERHQLKDDKLLGEKLQVKIFAGVPVTWKYAEPKNTRKMLFERSFKVAHLKVWKRMFERAWKPD